jgi:hypothetical protein
VFFDVSFDMFFGQSRRFDTFFRQNRLRNLK